ncbi:MAG TPA: sigma-54 dependent transcriptional regulator [Vicinamibacterales bacterium]|jgi:DNA-binding NtrC family response regulator
MTARGSILVTDDEEKIVRVLGSALREEGHEVVETTSPHEAKRLLATRPFDLFVVDNVMPELSGMDLIRELMGTSPEVERPHILLMTGHATIDGAIEAMKLGALDYLRKPFEIDHVIATAARVVETRRARLGNATPPTDDGDHVESGVVGQSPAIREVLRQAKVVAACNSTVLLTGETGTGKELVARAIHMHSPRRARPFIKVNCAAIPDNLLESELFGYVRGAFTGAMGNRRGKFALAERGSIFLDEIGTLSPVLQPKILRVIQEREFEPLGAERTERADVRIIAATNRDLSTMVSEGRFLEDLYYRLNVIPIHIPPLRNRPEDIPLLVEYFVRKHQRQVGKHIEGLEPSAMLMLQRYSWPGNVRELENTIERAVVLACGTVIRPQCVAVARAMPQESVPLPSMTLRTNVEWVERETVRRAVEAAHGVKRDAADLIGISQRALSYYLAKHNLEPGNRPASSTQSGGSQDGQA